MRLDTTTNQWWEPFSGSISWDVDKWSITGSETSYILQAYYGVNWNWTVNLRPYQLYLAKDSEQQIEVVLYDTLGDPIWSHLWFDNFDGINIQFDQIPVDREIFRLEFKSDAPLENQNITDIIWTIDEYDPPSKCVDGGILEECLDSADCAAAGGQWYNGQCNEGIAPAGNDLCPHITAAYLDSTPETLATFPTDKIVTAYLRDWAVILEDRTVAGTYDDLDDLVNIKEIMMSETRLYALDVNGNTFARGNIGGGLGHAGQALIDASGNVQTFYILKDGQAMAYILKDGTIKFVCWTSNLGTLEFHPDPLIWTDIVQVAAWAYGNQYGLLGLKSDGTIQYDGFMTNLQTEFTDFTDLIQIMAGPHFFYGLKNTGQVVVSNLGAYDGGFDIVDEMKSWGARKKIHTLTDIEDHSASIVLDGTVIVAHYLSTGPAYGPLPIDNVKNTQDWTDIVAIAKTRYNTYGIDINGQMYAVGENHPSWNQRDLANAQSGVLIGVDERYSLSEIQCIQNYCRLWDTTANECSLKLAEIIQKHIHQSHKHQLEHACEDKFTTECGLPAGAITGGAVPLAATLVNEFVGNEDLDDNSKVYGKDFKIDPTDPDMPPMLDPIENHPDNTATEIITWQEYVDSLE